MTLIEGRAVLAATTAVFIALAVIAGLSLPTNYDEIQYLSAAVLSQDKRIYVDFFHTQTPYLPLALGQWLNLMDWTGLSVWMLARIFNILWSISVVVLLAVGMARLGVNRWLAAGLLAAAMGTAYMSLPFRLVRNDSMALALALAGALALISAAQKPQGFGRSGRFLLAGALIAASAATKQSFAFVALALVAYPLLEFGATFRERAFGIALPLGIGALIGSLPMVYLAAPALDNFIYATVEFHRTVHALYSFGTTDVGLGIRLARIRELLADDSMQLLILGAAATLVLTPGIVRHAKDIWTSKRRGILGFCILSTAFLSASLLLMVPLWSHYLASIPSFVALGAAAWAGWSPTTMAGDPHRPLARFAALGAVMIVAAVALTINLSSNIIGLPVHMAIHVPDPAKPSINAPEGARIWLSQHIGPVRQRLSDILGPPDPSLTIATILNGYPLDAGFAIVPEFAATPFFYRENDHFSDETLARLAGTSPMRIGALLTERQVPAVLVGFWPTAAAIPRDQAATRVAQTAQHVEAGLVGYAVTSDFTCHTVDFTGAYNMSTAKLLVAPGLARVEPDC